MARPKKVPIQSDDITIDLKIRMPSGRYWLEQVKVENALTSEHKTSLLDHQIAIDCINDGLVKKFGRGYIKWTS